MICLPFWFFALVLLVALYLLPVVSP